MPVLQSTPLSGYSAVDTRSPDEAQELVGRIFCEHSLDVKRASADQFHALHNSARFDGFSINYVSYGSAVDIDPGYLGRIFLLQIPLMGQAQVRCGTATFDVAAGKTASLLSPTLPTTMRWDRGCGKLIALIDRTHVEQQAAAWADQAARHVEFTPHVDLRGNTGTVLYGLTRHLRDLAEHAHTGRPLSPAQQARLRDTLITMLLTGQQHTLLPGMRARRGGAAPAHVRRAEEFMEANLDSALSVADIAQASGVSLRALQDGFRRFRDTTIVSRLRDMRLERLHQALQCGGDTSVTHLAYDMGFSHLGRLAADYRRRYGHTPVETLRRARQRA